ncbi:hypothetical protein DRE_04850 [Drechslerella stenobrocha 248]|uniref:Annexin n=1 Tax=Drechslerella stenobrocha 248 TaxID=1043628 RepID=W7I0T7_9PEZI|nr:hypothetical protein DRE_04850 [Drechslerella stenobrocha 248]
MAAQYPFHNFDLHPMPWDPNPGYPYHDPNLQAWDATPNLAAPPPPPAAPVYDAQWLHHHNHQHHHHHHQLDPQHYPAQAYLQPGAAAALQPPAHGHNAARTEDPGCIRRYFGGFHYPEVTSIITNRTPTHLQAVLLGYQSVTGHDLLATLKDMSRGSLRNNLAIDSAGNKYFNIAATAIFLGPVQSEGFWAVRAVKGAGTNEMLLTEAIFGRTNAELEAIKTYVRSCYGKTLEDYVRSDLSMGTKALFDMGMEQHPSKDPPGTQQLVYDYDKLQLDVQRIISATPRYNIFAKHSAALCHVLTQRTPDQLAAIAVEYERETGKALRDLVGRVIFGHMKDALLYVLDGAVDRVGRDARLIEDAMAGPGTKHHLLMARLIRVHWDKRHLAEVKVRYQQLFKQELVHRLRKGIKGGFRDLMIAVAESDVSPWKR